MPPQRLCRLDEIADPGAKGPFAVGRPEDRLKIFLVRRGAAVWGWIDSCPHAGAPLEMEPDQFFDITGEYLLCSLHGAHFHPKSGSCVLGPCRGRGLTPYPVHHRNDEVLVGNPTEEP